MSFPKTIYVVDDGDRLIPYTRVDDLHDFKGEVVAVYDLKYKGKIDVGVKFTGLETT